MYDIYSRDAQASAYNYVVNQNTVIEREVVRMQYPDVQYPDLIPIDSATGNEWVKSITYMSQDMTGRADWFHHTALDVPLAELTREKFERGIEMAAIGYRWTIEEVANAMNTPGLNLTADKATACRRAYEEFVDDIGLRGSAREEHAGSDQLVRRDGNDSPSGWHRFVNGVVLEDQRADHP